MPDRRAPLERTPPAGIEATYRCATRDAWVLVQIASADARDFHAFTRGLELDELAIIAALILPFHNGRTEGVNTKTEMIKRQMYGAPDSRSCATVRSAENDEN